MRGTLLVQENGAEGVCAPTTPEPSLVPRKGGAYVMPICKDSTPTRSAGQCNLVHPVAVG